MRPLRLGRCNPGFLEKARKKCCESAVLCSFPSFRVDSRRVVIVINPVSSFQNSWPQPESPLVPESPLPPPPRLAEDPPWSGWDVLQIIAVMAITLTLVPLGVVLLAHRLFYPRMSLGTIVEIPGVVLAAQIPVYVVLLALMYFVVEAKSGKFWEPLRWNWPTSFWAAFLALGVVVYFVLGALSQLLPIPSHLPIDRFFQTAREAALMSILSVTLAPLMEELFFRGLLYPVLARRLGTWIGILITSAAFGLLHAAQLKYSWAVLIIFLVGLALTTVRAITKSVGASFLVHAAYNGTLSSILLIATDGFRHLEKLSQ